MQAVLVTIAQTLLYAIAWAWIFGFYFVQKRLPENEPYSQRRDLAALAALAAYMFAGYALYRWVIPAPWNPFFG